MENIIRITSDYVMIITEASPKKYINHAMIYAFIAKTINELELKSLSEILRHARLTEKSVCFINGMLHISEDMDYPTTLKFVENIEENILFADISENEKQFPLLFAAVAKGSIKYWIKQLEDANSPWIDILSEIGMTMEDVKWAWREDGQGAIAGMFNGALAGIFTNSGAGTMAFSMSVGCSVAASVATIIDKIIAASNNNCLTINKE